MSTPDPDFSAMTLPELEEHCRLGRERLARTDRLLRRRMLRTRRLVYLDSRRMARGGECLAMIKHFYLDLIDPPGFEDDHQIRLYAACLEADIEDAVSGRPFDRERVSLISFAGLDIPVPIVVPTPPVESSAPLPPVVARKPVVCDPPPTEWLDDRAFPFLQNEVIYCGL